MSKIKSLNLFNFIENTPEQTKSQVKRQKKFIEKARKIHGDKYDYSKVVYKKSSEKVIIICSTHGEFWQTPDNHTNQKQGCPKCAKNYKLTTKTFIEKAKNIHGNKYNYSKVEYVNAHTKVTIICPIHGEFEQMPYQHIQKHECPKCGGYNTGIKLSKTLEHFIKQAIIIHGSKYDYSKVKYVNTHTKVKIICKKHGNFYQEPNNHLSGNGCPICNIENSNFVSGLYVPKYPEKYSSDVDKIIYRSSYELKAFEMIEEDENIISWESETIRIPYIFNRKSHKYIVDLKIETKTGIKLIEIKPESKVEYPKYNYLLEEYNQNQAKWNAAKEYCKERNWEFEIWTEKELGI